MKLWDIIDEAERKALWRRWPTIRPPDSRLDEVESVGLIKAIMQEPPIGTQACIGKIPLRRRV